MANARISTYPIEVNGQARQIRLDTQKGSRGLRSTATVVTPSADGLGYSYVLFEDYSATVVARPEARATDKAIADLHAQACAKIDDVRAAALAHYAKLAAKEAA